MKTGKMMWVAALLLVAFVPPGCAQAKGGKDEPSAAGALAAPMPSSDRMPMVEFKKLLAKGEVVVIDVRSNGSYVEGHIPGALSVPEDTINAALAEKLKRMGKPIVAYCS